MKEGSDNFRESAVMDIIDKFLKRNIKVFVYEPFLNENDLTNIVKVETIDELINNSDIILANRMSDDLESVKHKVYSRDVFNEN